MYTLNQYKCSECGKVITVEELKMNAEYGLQFSVLGCTEHIVLVAKREKAKHLVWMKLNIVKVMTEREVPLRYLECSFDNFQAVDPERKKYLRKAKKYVDLNIRGMGEGMFFTGPNGTGKTHLAVATIRELSLAKGCLNWRFIKTPKLLMTIRQAFKGEGADNEYNLIKKFVDYDYLVIDELGVEKSTEWGLQTLYLIVDGRSDELKQTIITSNLSPQDIHNKIDPRLASRIVGMSKEILEFKCDDWRLRKVKK